MYTSEEWGDFGRRLQLRIIIDWTADYNRIYYYYYYYVCWYNSDIGNR